MCGRAIGRFVMQQELPEIWLEPEPPLVLIAQPDEAVRSQMIRELEGYRIRTAVDGNEAFQMVQAAKPDAIVAAFHMPGLNGLELCQALRVDPVLCWVPVAMTAPCDCNAFEDAVLAGASEVITMPFSPAELRLRLRNMIRGHIYLQELERKNKVITEALNDLQQSEAMLVQAEKLSCLGEMSAGIVHEINNPLNYSKSALFVLQRMVADMDSCEEKEEFEELVGDVSDGLERVGRIVRDLRSFAMKGTVQVTNVDLRHVVGTVTRLMGDRLSNITYLQNVPEGLLIRGNENNLCQVLLNLVKNGIEAAEAAGRTLDQAEIQITGTETEDGVRLRVRDNGCGLSTEEQAKMFEPFFTTKDRGRGMGLGLSICRRIIEDHGATISVRSQQGVYTEFTLSFPPGYQGETEEEFEEIEPRVRETVMDYQD